MRNTLETDRLILRMFAEKDLGAYRKMCSHPEVMRYMGDGKPLDRLIAWRHVCGILGHWQLRGYGLWAVEEKASGELIGRVGFINPDGWPGLEVGWTIAYERWGHGFATEAARACLAHGFTEFGFDHVISLIRPDNKRSIAVAERIREQREGMTELLGNEVIVYGIDKKDWERE